MAWHHGFRAGLSGITMMAFAACSVAPAPQDVRGECQQVFGGDVCTWGTLAGGMVTEFGATAAMTTVENAPMEGEMVFPPVPEAVIPLPVEIATATGFSHLAVNWETHGHPPAPFMTPHFDFHFYTIAPEQVQAIDCADTRKPAALPPGYALPDIEIPGMGTLIGLCVPGMGMHGMPSADIEAADPFGASMVVGYYGGELTFLEPMIARARLMESRTFEMTVPPAPPGTPAAVRWPSRFDAIYDADARVYRFVFSMQSP
jgi:hypothetical protein